MSIQRAEQLKRDWTDQFVVVRKGVPELRRFDGFVGQVKTVNMNCRLLIQFDTPADISWYDIDPQFVSAVNLAERNPQAETETPPLQTPPPAALQVTTPAPAPVTQPTSSASPLDIIRRQSAAKASRVKQTSSPLDQIRAQAAGGPRSTAAAQNPADKADESKAPVDSASSTAAAGESPLDRIRAQAAKSQAATGATVQSSSESASASLVSGDGSGTETPVATTADPFRVGTASSPDPATDKPGTGAEPDVGTGAPGTKASIDNRISSPVDQIRTQAAADGETPVNIQSALFEQIRRQAAEPEPTNISPAE